VGFAHFENLVYNKEHRSVFFFLLKPRRLLYDFLKSYFIVEILQEAEFYFITTQKKLKQHRKFLSKLKTQ